MRIAVNLLPFREHLAGAGRYSREILREWTAADAGNEFVFFVTPRARAHFAFGTPNITPVVVVLPESILARIAYEQFVLRIQLERYNIDLLFTPSVAIPLFGRKKRVTVIYDMIADAVRERRLTKYPPLRSAYVRAMSRFAAQHSDAVITISENSKREIVRYAQVSPAKIALAPPATNLTRVTAPDVPARVQDKYRLPEKFILYLGTLEPGKNLPRLIQAYTRLKDRHPELPQHLVLAGAQGWGVREIEAEIAKSGATGFHLVGFVEQDDLAAVYTLADVFVYPSLYEGFGIPPLEAMACGTPVIVSNVSALPEVLGEPWTGQVAGILVDPADVDALANAMGRVLTDEALRAKLIQAGLKRAGELSWASSADVVAQVVRRVQELP